MRSSESSDHLQVQQDAATTATPTPTPTATTANINTNTSLSDVGVAGESFVRVTDDDEDRKPQLRVSTTTMKVKRIKMRKKVRGQKLCIQIMSDLEVIDDGYKWRKYGQKVAKDTLHPRNYYRCTNENCWVKKRIERLAEDPRVLTTTYEGIHNHAVPVP